ncbi:MAG: hypothetical protein ACI9J2_001879 [Saprospiraceae bacterium]|jgi:hypothetical protein
MSEGYFLLTRHGLKSSPLLMKACNSCGKCCIKYSNGDLSASDQDLESWESLRPEIYRYVRDGKIWMDPATGKQEGKGVRSCNHAFLLSLWRDSLLSNAL